MSPARKRAGELGRRALSALEVECHIKSHPPPSLVLCLALNRYSELMPPPLDLGALGSWVAVRAAGVILHTTGIHPSQRNLSRTSMRDTRPCGGRPRPPVEVVRLLMPSKMHAVQLSARSLAEPSSPGMMPVAHISDWMSTRMKSET